MLRYFPILVAITGIYIGTKYFNMDISSTFLPGAAARATRFMNDTTLSTVSTTDLPKYNPLQGISEESLPFALSFSSVQLENIVSLVCSTSKADDESQPAMMQELEEFLLSSSTSGLGMNTANVLLHLTKLLSMTPERVSNDSPQLDMPLISFCDFSRHHLPGILLKLHDISASLMTSSSSNSTQFLHNDMLRKDLLTKSDYSVFFPFTTFFDLTVERAVDATLFPLDDNVKYETTEESQSPMSILFLNSFNDRLLFESFTHMYSVVNNATSSRVVAPSTISPLFNLKFLDDIVPSFPSISSFEDIQRRRSTYYSLFRASIHADIVSFAFDRLSHGDLTPSLTSFSPLQKVVCDISLLTTVTDFPTTRLSQSSLSAFCPAFNTSVATQNESDVPSSFPLFFPFPPAVTHLPGMKTNVSDNPSLSPAILKSFNAYRESFNSFPSSAFSYLGVPVSLPSRQRPPFDISDSSIIPRQFPRFHLEKAINRAHDYLLAVMSTKNAQFVDQLRTLRAATVETLSVASLLKKELSQDVTVEDKDKNKQKRLFELLKSLPDEPFRTKAASRLVTLRDLSSLTPDSLSFDSSLAAFPREEDIAALIPSPISQESFRLSFAARDIVQVVYLADMSFDGPETLGLVTSHALGSHHVATKALSFSSRDLWHFAGEALCNYRNENIAGHFVSSRTEQSTKCDIWFREMIKASKSEINSPMVDDLGDDGGHDDAPFICDYDQTYHRSHGRNYTNTVSNWEDAFYSSFGTAKTPFKMNTTCLLPQDPLDGPHTITIDETEGMYTIDFSHPRRPASSLEASQRAARGFVYLRSRAAYKSGNNSTSYDKDVFAFADSLAGETNAVSKTHSPLYPRGMRAPERTFLSTRHVSRAFREAILSTKLPATSSKSLEKIIDSLFTPNYEPKPESEEVDTSNIFEEVERETMMEKNAAEMYREVIDPEFDLSKLSPLATRFLASSFSGEYRARDLTIDLNEKEKEAVNVLFSYLGFDENDDWNNSKYSLGKIEKNIWKMDYLIITMVVAQLRAFELRTSSPYPEGSGNPNRFSIPLSISSDTITQPTTSLLEAGSYLLLNDNVVPVRAKEKQGHYPPLNTLFFYTMFHQRLATAQWAEFGKCSEESELHPVAQYHALVIATANAQLNRIPLALQPLVPLM